MKNWQEAERLAAEFITYLGFDGVELEQGGADGGVDVRVPGLLVAQVKATRSRVGRPVIQQIYGIGQAEGALPVVFSLSGFSKQAAKWADEHSIALFTFHKTVREVEVKPFNAAALELIKRAHDEFGIRLPPSSLPKWSELSGWKKVYRVIVILTAVSMIISSSWRQLLILFIISIFSISLVVSCFASDDFVQNPPATNVSRCPIDDLADDERCTSDPELSERCKFRPEEERGEYWRDDRPLCPYGFEIIDP
jgi:hypothetical protein